MTEQLTIVSSQLGQFEQRLAAGDEKALDVARHHAEVHADLSARQEKATQDLQGASACLDDVTARLEKMRLAIDQVMPAVYGVRQQRHEMLEFRQETAALSARLTMLQRALSSVRTHDDRSPRTEATVLRSYIDTTVTALREDVFVAVASLRAEIALRATEDKEEDRSAVADRS